MPHFYLLTLCALIIRNAEAGSFEATVAMILSKAKVVFNWAVEKKYIEESPLKGVDKGSFENKKNDREITMAEYYKLLDAAICQE